MSSILTNTSAMVALQTLNGINKSMGMVQSEISTGKSVATARDNASVWAIAQTMQSDVDGFNGIKDSLATGSSQLGVARSAAETVTDLLIQVKEKVVAAQDSGADSTKLMADVTELTGQINSVVSAAQFNGVNLVDGATATMEVLSSIDRDNTGAVTPSYITVTGQDLSTDAVGAFGSAIFSGTNFTAAGNADASASLDQATAATATLVIADPGFAAGDSVSLQVGEQSFTYQFTDADVAAGNAPADIAAVNLKTQIENAGIDGLTVAYDSAAAGELAFDISGAAAGTAFSIVAQATPANTGNLSGLSSISAGNIGTAATLESVEGMITTAIDAAAALGSSQGRIDTQMDFVGKLTDSLKTGIGALVDADMEEASARLQALQVQQQLGIQSLSIANQAPQNLLSLFR